MVKECVGVWMVVGVASPVTFDGIMVVQGIHEVFGIFFVNILLLISTIAQHIVFNAMQHILHRHVKTILSAIIGQKLNQDYGFKLVRLNFDSKFFNVATNYQHYD